MSLIISAGYWRWAWTPRNYCCGQEWSLKECWGYTLPAWPVPSPCWMSAYRSWPRWSDARLARWIRDLLTIVGVTRWSSAGCPILLSLRRDWWYGFSTWRGLLFPPSERLLSISSSFSRWHRWNLWAASAYLGCRLNCSFTWVVMSHSGGI